MTQSIDLKTLEFKTPNQLSDNERAFIRDTYKAYFMTCKPRIKAIGLCVVCGGVPTPKVGLIDVRFLLSPITQKPCYSLKYGQYPIIVQDCNVKNAIDEYLHSDEIFSMYLDAKNIPEEGVVIPLFQIRWKGNNKRLTDAHNIIHAAGKAIGFNAKSLRLHLLGDCIVSPFHVSFDEETGLSFTNCLTTSQLIV